MEEVFIAIAQDLLVLQSGLVSMRLEQRRNELNTATSRILSLEQKFSILQRIDPSGATSTHARGSQ